MERLACVRLWHLVAFCGISAYCIEHVQAAQQQKLNARKVIEQAEKAGILRNHECQ